jgi:hypothetical protein
MTNQDTALESNAKRKARHTQDIMEFMSALLMAVATIASAWCGYKSTSWNGQQYLGGREFGKSKKAVLSLFAGRPW